MIMRASRSYIHLPIEEPDICGTGCGIAINLAPLPESPPMADMTISHLLFLFSGLSGSLSHKQSKKR